MNRLHAMGLPIALVCIVVLLASDGQAGWLHRRVGRRMGSAHGCAPQAAATPPPIFFRNWKGEHAQRQAVGDDLLPFEIELQKEMVGRCPPDEIFALASAGTMNFFMYMDRDSQIPDPRELLVIALYGSHGELRSTWDFGKRRAVRRLSPAEFAAVRAFAASNHDDDLPWLTSSHAVLGMQGERQIVGGTQYAYLRMNRRWGRHVLINNPPVAGDRDYPANDPIRRYTRVIDFFAPFTPPAVPAGAMPNPLPDLALPEKSS